MEMPGIEPGAFHMQSERSTTEPHPHVIIITRTGSLIDYVNKDHEDPAVVIFVHIFVQIKYLRNTINLFTL